MIKNLVPFGIGILLAPFNGMTRNPTFDVYVPYSICSNEFTASAIFLRSGGSNDYAVLVSPFNANVPVPILSPSWEPKGIDPDFHGGFTLGFRHVFSHSGADFSLYWAHLRGSDSGTFFVDREPPPAQQMTGPFWSIGPDAGTTSSANGELNNHYDVVNAEFGKYINFDPNLKIRLFAGLSGLWIKQKITADFAGSDPVLGNYTFDISTRSKFNAIGMRLGLQGAYPGCYKVNVVGLFAGNLYIGHLYPFTQTAGTGSILTFAGIPENHQFISHRHFTQLVPALDAKLGLKYAHQYSPTCAFAIEAGYMASIYLNAIQNYVPSTFVPGSQGLITGSGFLQSLLKTTDSFSVDGPYVSFSFKM